MLDCSSQKKNSIFFFCALPLFFGEELSAASTLKLTVPLPNDAKCGFSSLTSKINFQLVDSYR